MKKFNVHTVESAPGEASGLLSAGQSQFGFVPNLLAVLAESPSALKGYMELGHIFEHSELTPVEQQVVILATSRFNDCRYCMSAHTVIAGMHSVPEQAIAALRNDEPIDDPRLEALRKFTTSVVENRGFVPESEVKAFLEAGFSRAQILAVILGVSLKTISNYTNHIAETPLDEVFAGQKWQPVS